LQLTEIDAAKPVLPRIADEFVVWQCNIALAYQKKMELEETFSAEPKHFYNADRILWLLVQQKVPLLEKLPNEVVRKICFLLPPVLHGTLIFCRGYHEDWGCARSTTIRYALVFNAIREKGGPVLPEEGWRKRKL